jgi:hypothetical protein
MLPVWSVIARWDALAAIAGCIVVIMAMVAAAVAMAILRMGSVVKVCSFSR